MKNTAAAPSTRGLHRRNYDFAVKTGISCRERWTLQAYGNVTSMSQGGISISIIPESINENSTSILIMKHRGPAHKTPGVWHRGCRRAASPWLRLQLSHRLRQPYQPPKVAAGARFQEGNLLP